MTIKKSIKFNKRQIHGMKYIVSMQECDVLGVNANAVDDNFNAI